MYNKDKIIQYIQQKGQVPPHELVQFLGVGKAMVHRHLKDLVINGILVKLGTPPRVFYMLKNETYLKHGKKISATPEQSSILKNNFTLILPNGMEMEGYDGFLYWCNERNYDPEKKIVEFEKTIQDYAQFSKNGIIDATQKINATFSKEKQFLDHLYFLHPYSLPVFGKTKIATWLFHGKQTQNKLLINRVLDNIIPELQHCIVTNTYDAIAFVPPSIPREFQFMKALEQRLASPLPVIKIEKIKNPIIIQQKSLKELNDRIINAESTMVVTTNTQYKKVLVIDDFTGSGATLNVIAEKMKRQAVAESVDGITITGSMNGFEVIREI